MKRVLYTFLFILISCLMLGIITSAVSIPDDKDDNIKWEVTFTDYGSAVEENGKTISGSATVTGVTLVNYTQAGFNIPSYFENEGKTYVVTELSDNAFSTSGDLVFGKMTLPENLTKIGANAFKGTRIYGDIVIPNTVTSIGEGAFEECDGITSVKLPDDILSIPKNTFKKCYSLTSVISSDDLFEIGNSAFYDCESLLNISIGSGTLKIRDSAFYKCQALGGTIDLSAVSTLENNAFDYCTNVEEFILPKAAFNSTAFSECYKLKKFSYPDGVTETDFYYIDEYGVLYSSDKKTLLNYPAKLKLSRYEIPKVVTKIEAYAFYKAGNLGFVNIPDSVTTIGNYAFAWTSLETFYAPNSVTTFGEYMLSRCDNLKWVVLGSNVKVAKNLLSECEKLPEIIIYKSSSFTKDNVNVNLYVSANSYLCTTHYFGYRGTPATCTESGLNTCAVCEYSVFAKATGHTGSIVEISELSCTTDAYILYDCPNCDDKNDPHYPYATLLQAKAPGHDATPTVVAPTSTTPGYTITVCKACNETVVSDYSADFFTLGDINNDGHISSTDITVLSQYLGGVSLYVNPASCDLNGNKTIDIYDLIILKRFVAQLDELPNVTSVCSKHMHVVSLPAAEASCIGGGVNILYCSDCGTLIDAIITEELGHTWVTDIQYKATCQATGRIDKHCSVCKEKVTEIIDSLPHTGNWWTIPGQKEYQYRTCTVCGSLDSTKVDYSKFEKLLGQLSPNYLGYFNKTETQQSKHAMYYTEDSLALLAPIMENYKLALTQDLVDQNTEELKKILPRLEYNVSGVPSIYITTDGSHTLERNMPYIGAEIVVAYYDENGNYVNYIERDGEMKVRGNSTAGHAAKHPYNIKFNTDVNLFGLGADNKYCLMANALEPTMMRNAMVRYFNEIIGLDHYCKFEFVDVYCNDVFKGCYMMCTPVDIEETRVNINKDSDFILEVEWNDGGIRDNDALYLQSPYTNFRIKVDSHEKEEISSSGYSALYSTIYQADFALMSGDWNEIQKYFDVDSLARYYILHEYMKDVDYAWDSTRFCLENGKITAGPAWDFDRAIGHANKSGGNASCRDAYYNSSAKPSIGGVALDGATGTWANVAYNGMPRIEYDDANTTPDKLWLNKPVSSNMISQNGNNSWYTFLYYYSPEFMDLVAKYIWESKDLLMVMYADTTDELGNITTNFIDSLYNDTDFYESVLRNYDSKGANHSLWNSTAEGWNFSTYTAAIDHLRSWLTNRYNWMMNFYCFEYIKAEEATELLKQYENNKLNNTTTASLSKVNGEFIYTVNLDASADFGYAAHFDDMCNLIKNCFSFYEKVKLVFNYNLDGKKVTLSKEIVNANPDSFMEMRLETLETVLTTDKSVNKYADTTEVKIEAVNGGSTVTITINVTDSSAYYNGNNFQNNTLTSAYNKIYNNITQYLYDRGLHTACKNQAVFVFNFDNNVTKTVTIDKHNVVIK